MEKSTRKKSTAKKEMASQEESQEPFKYNQKKPLYKRAKSCKIFRKFS